MVGWAWALNSAWLTAGLILLVGVRDRLPFARRVNYALIWASTLVWWGVPAAVLLPVPWWGIGMILLGLVSVGLLVRRGRRLPGA